MIIKTPTGLYSSVLPHNPGDGGNVTFTISTADPPRTNLLFPKLSPGVSDRRKLPRTIDVAVRRQDLDVLLYTVQRSGRSALGTGMRQYEVGQVLEFGDPASLRTLDPFTAGMESETRHDTGLIDYDRLGVTAEQQDAVQQLGQLAYSAKRAELADARVRYDQTLVNIQENQKLIAETTKALDALAVLGDSRLGAVVAELSASRQRLFADRSRLAGEANELAQAATAILGQLRSLAQVVR